MLPQDHNAGKLLLIEDMPEIADSIEILTVRDLVFDTTTLLLMRAGRELTASPIALRILAVLVRQSPRVISRRDIEREIWSEAVPDSDTLRSHLYKLRCVIDKPFDRPLLRTVHASGYRLADLNAEGGSRHAA